MWRLAVSAALLLCGSVVTARSPGEPPSLDDYDYGGQTTYCFWIEQGLSVQRLDFSYVKIEAENRDCPMTLTLTQTTSTAVMAGDDVEFQVEALLEFDDNAFGMTGLERMVLDPFNGRPVQIAHANVHACFRSTVCDIFRDGSNRRVSAQETSNFTAGTRATFNQKVNFNRAGEYNVFAHLILPPVNPLNETYHFLAFTTTMIDPITTTTTATGPSTGTIVAILVGAVALIVAVVVGVIFYRRRPGPMTPGQDHFRHSGFHTTHTSKHHTSKLDWNGDPDFQFGHDRYQGSMASEYKQPPGLNASVLMFQDRSSRATKQKTVSSSGSSTRASSPRGYHDNYRTGGGRSSAYPKDMAAIQLPQHGIDTYDAYYNEGGYTNDLKLYTTDGSVDTGRGHGYAGNPRGLYDDTGYDARTQPTYGKSYGRETDSVMEDYSYDDRSRADTDDTLRPVSEVSQGSDASSLGTVDFALPPLPKGFHPSLRSTGDSFQAENVPNLADTQLTFNDAEVSKQTIEYIDSLRSQQQYRPSDQASDYVSDFGSTSRTFDYRDSTQSDNDDMHSFRSTDHQFTDTKFRNKRTPSADSEAYEF